MKYRKKPVVIDAVQFDGSNHQELYEFSEGNCRSCKPWKENYSVLQVETLEGVMEGGIYDWLIRGVKGEYYFCKPDIFDATYDVEDGKKRVAMTRDELLTAFEEKRRKLGESRMPTLLELLDEIFGEEKA